MSALSALQTAVVARLAAAAGLTALVGTRIYDGEAPEGSPLPYVVVGETTEGHAGALGKFGFRDTLTLHIWSGTGNRAESLAILGQVDLALRTNLAIAGHTSAEMRLDLVTTLVEEDGIRHVPARYRILTFEVA